MCLNLTLSKNTVPGDPSNIELRTTEASKMVLSQDRYVTQMITQNKRSGTWWVAQIVKSNPKLFLTLQIFGIIFILGPKNIYQTKDFKDLNFECAAIAECSYKPVGHTMRHLCST